MCGNLWLTENQVEHRVSFVHFSYSPLQAIILRVLKHEKCSGFLDFSKNWWHRLLIHKERSMRVTQFCAWSTSIRGWLKKHILHPQTLLYLFYQFILQLTLYLSFYFYIQLNKIIKNIIPSLFPPTLFFSSHTTTIFK